MIDEQTEAVTELAAEAGLVDAAALTLYGRVHSALSKEFGEKEVDSGIGRGVLDFWIRSDGMEYKVIFRPHRALGKPQ